MRGFVKWFNHAKGFGFISPFDGSPAAFVHVSEVAAADLRVLADGDVVEFNIVQGNLGPAAVQVVRVGPAGTVAASVASSPAADTPEPAESASDPLLLLRHDERALLAVNGMTSEQKQALRDWGLRMFSLGQHRVAYIDAIKYEGHLVVLDDGSRWAVDSPDQVTASLWNELDRVAVIDGQMFLLDESEVIHVEEELD